PEPAAAAPTATPPKGASPAAPNAKSDPKTKVAPAAPAAPATPTAPIRRPSASLDGAPPRPPAAVRRGFSRSARQPRRSHQKFVDRVRGLAAFADRPDHQRLAAADVAGGEHLVDRGAVIVGRGGDVAALVELEPEVFHQALVHRMHEAHGEQHQIGVDLE